MSRHLRALQENLQAYLLTGDAKIAETIVEPGQDEINARLAIYRDSYYLCLLNNLKKDYPLLEKMLGEAAFEALGLAYINACPSQSFSINNFGQRLPAFLRTTSPYSERPYLSELAEFIWELDNTLISADAPVLSVNDLAAISPEQWGQLHLMLHPSVKLLKQQHNVISIWQALQQANTSPTVVQLNEPDYCLIWRKALIPYSLVLTKEAACIITALQAQHTFADVCEQLTTYLPAEAVAQYAVNQLINWLNQGIFSRLKIQIN